MSWARTHLRIAELGCLASMPLRRARRDACVSNREHGIQAGAAAGALRVTVSPRRLTAGRRAGGCWRCGGSAHIFSSTMPLQCDEPPKGLHLNCVPRFAFLYDLFAHLFLTRVVRSLRAALIPRGLPEPMLLPVCTGSERRAVRRGDDCDRGPGRLGSRGCRRGSKWPLFPITPWEGSMFPSYFC